MLTEGLDYFCGVTWVLMTCKYGTYCKGGGTVLVEKWDRTFAIQVYVLEMICGLQSS